MSIKSEKARESYYQLSGDCTAKEVEPIVIQAESDAETRCRAEDRERAVRAFQTSCTEHRNGKCVDDPHETTDCFQSAHECYVVRKFLKHYDNGQ